MEKINLYEEAGSQEQPFENLTPGRIIDRILEFFPGNGPDNVLARVQLGRAIMGDVVVGPPTYPETPDEVYADLLQRKVSASLASMNNQLAILDRIPEDQKPEIEARLQCLAEAARKADLTDVAYLVKRAMGPPQDVL